MLLRSRSYVVIAWLILGAALARGQGHVTSPCPHTEPDARVVVRGYMFTTYRGLNSGDPACLEVFRGGRVVFRLAEKNVEAYYLGQPGDAERKISRVANGVDLTGEGHADMIVTSWSGGAHCCMSHYVFELEPGLRLVSKIDDGDADGYFQKLEIGHGYQYISADIWSYWPGSFASSVSHKVLLRWDGEAFRLDLARMRASGPSDLRWKADLKAVDTSAGEGREAIAATLWDRVLDLIYSGHADLAWKFVRDVNPAALSGDLPSLGEFCTVLRSRPYWRDLKGTLGSVPTECAAATASAKKG